MSAPFGITEAAAAEWALRHDVESVLKDFSTRRCAIEDARTMHLLDSGSVAPAARVPLDGWKFDRHHAGWVAVEPNGRCHVAFDRPECEETERVLARLCAILATPTPTIAADAAAPSHESAVLEEFRDESILDWLRNLRGTGGCNSAAIAHIEELYERLSACTAPTPTVAADAAAPKALPEGVSIRAFQAAQDKAWWIFIKHPWGETPVHVKHLRDANLAHLLYTHRTGEMKTNTANDAAVQAAWHHLHAEGAGAPMLTDEQREAIKWACLNSPYLRHMHALRTLLDAPAPNVAPAALLTDELRAHLKDGAKLLRMHAPSCGYAARAIEAILAAPTTVAPASVAPWISVKERAPTEAGTVLAFFRLTTSSAWQVGPVFANIEGFEPLYPGARSIQVSHWMPMPPAPNAAPTPTVAADAANRGDTQ